mmetsp:Transcript_5511/g.13605  ORF Transcript_5511/g.13605 Transcript_5511/m.13605 type:complete len:223 (-) Transcript_5511:267-935(-)
MTLHPSHRTVVVPHRLGIAGGIATAKHVAQAGSDDVGLVHAEEDVGHRRRRRAPHQVGEICLPCLDQHIRGHRPCAPRVGHEEDILREVLRHILFTELRFEVPVPIRRHVEGAAALDAVDQGLRFRCCSAIGADPRNAPNETATPNRPSSACRRNRRQSRSLRRKWHRRQRRSHRRCLAARQAVNLLFLHLAVPLPPTHRSGRTRECRIARASARAALLARA